VDKNNVELVGTVDQQPSCKEVGSGRKLTTLLVRTVDRWEARDGRQGERVAVIPVTAWGNLGAEAMNRLRAGDGVRIEGRIGSKAYERDGETRYFLEVTASRIEPLAMAPDPRQRSIPGTDRPPPSKHTTRYAGSMHGDDSDIPF
jgi:single-strand DNA-binding protein